MLLDAGSLVAADGRLLECYNLQVNESSLTGESLPVEKRAGVIGTGPRNRAAGETRTEKAGMEIAKMAGRSRGNEMAWQEGKNRQEFRWGDQYNMVFAGSLVTGGRGVFVVTATGMERRNLERLPGL